LILLRNVFSIEKCGKAAGIDSLKAENIHLAHPILLDHLVCLFLMMYKYSMVPDDFYKEVVIPSIKNAEGDKFTTDNYCDITLSPVISKLTKIVLSQFKDQLSSDPLQFGFNSRSSCSKAVFTFKTVVNHYIRNDCTVTVCALDISKACLMF